jgi:hypothetical protein
VARELLDLNRFDDVISKAYYVMFCNYSEGEGRHEGAALEDSAATG